MTMTKSIEKQADEYYKKSGWAPTENAVMNFKAGAKARDAEWLKVVNELKDCAQDIIKNKMVHPFEYHHYSREDMVELLRVSLAKTDQMMKEMGISL